MIITALVCITIYLSSLIHLLRIQFSWKPRAWLTSSSQEEDLRLLEHFCQDGRNVK